MYEKYCHHGREVWVKSSMRGKHMEYCLCWNCEKFQPENRGKICWIANLLYAVNDYTGITTPVFECPDFKEKEF